MDPNEAKDVLRGPMIPIITNVKPDVSLDHDAIASNVRHAVERGSFSQLKFR